MSNPNTPVDQRDSRERRNLVPTSREDNFRTAKGKRVTTTSPTHNGDPGPSSRSQSSKTPDSASPTTLDKGKGRADISSCVNDNTSGVPDRYVRTKVQEINRRASDAKHDNLESGPDSLGSRADVDEVERLLEEETRRETKYWEQRAKKENQLKDIRGRKTQVRQDMRSDRFTEDDRKEFKAKYERLEQISDWAEKEIEALERQLNAAKDTIKKLRNELKEVRRELVEQESENFEMRLTIKDLRGQVKELQERLDATEVKLKKYEEKYPELADTDNSTPASSEVSSEVPENSPTARGPGIAASDRTLISHAPDEEAEKRHRQCSLSETVKDSDTGDTLTRTSTRSSGTSSKKREGWEEVKKSSRTQEYDSLLVPGGKVVKEETNTLLKPVKSHHKKSSSKDSQRKKSRASREPT